MGIFLCVPTLAPGMHSPHGRQLQSQAIVMQASTSDSGHWTGSCGMMAQIPPE